MHLLNGNNQTTDDVCILIVDDRRATRLVIKNVLQKEGYKIIEAENGEIAIDMFLENKPDVILLDIMMPVMDGLSACKRIRKLPDGANLPILMFTGLDDGKSVEMAFQAGASDFITKPINWEELKYRVLRLLHMRNIEETVQRQQYYDSLTNLPNRTLLKDRLTVAITQAAAERTRLAVIFMNIKNFSLINDAFGYDQGDNLIVDIADKFTKQIDREVTISRMGGDDFAFILSKADDVNEAIKLAEQIIKIIDKPWIIDGQEINIAADVGIAMYPNDGEDEQTLLKNAETAMTRAAMTKHNSYSFYNQEMNSRALERIALENALRYAITRNELVNHYQPKVDCETGNLTGVEALVRWQHPEYGLVPPMEFIPLAEEIGMIISIGEWVLYTACSQVYKWHELGHKLSLSVNFSAIQFQQPDLIESIRKILSATKLEAKYLTVEITESIAMKDVNFTIKILKDLKSMGVEVSIDDFGTGYSSLSYLKRLPINELKIDRSFVRDITTDQDDAAIVDMILVLGKALKLKIVAEGVEDTEQLEFLKNRKCTEIQGYYFSKPLPADEFEKRFLF